MEEVVKLIGEYGVLIVIAGVYIWNQINTSKIVENILKELQTSSRLQSNTLESLGRACENQSNTWNTMQVLLANIAQAIEQHDNRLEKINGDIRESHAIIKSGVYTGLRDKGIIDKP